MTAGSAELRAVIASMEGRGAVVAVGGSGLLLALGLVHAIRDWDLTTDAPTDLVEDALLATGLPFVSMSAGDGVFASRARFRVDIEGPPIDVIVGFALSVGSETVPLPATVAFTWSGLPMASPAVWERAYRLLGREREADLLKVHIGGECGAT